MDTRRIRCGEASLVHVRRRILGNSPEFICGWSGKSFVVKFAMIIIFGLSVLLVPFSLTFTAALRQRLIESSLIATRGTSIMDIVVGVPGLPAASALKVDAVCGEIRLPPGVRNKRAFGSGLGAESS